MAKRTKTCEELPSNKRAKPNDFDDLWDDDLDLDENVIDDCFTLATQVLEQKDITCTQLNNVSILPSYSAFKGQRNLFSSTQSAPNINQTVFPTRFGTNNGICTETRAHSETKFKQLQDKILAKEGEVAILRSQLKEIKTNYEVESAKTRKEWMEKLNEKTKEIKEIQSKLEFKDLEIINLKQKSSEITKVNSNLNVSLNCTQGIKFKENLKPCSSKEISLDSSRLQPITDKWCPLHHSIPQCIFNVVKQETYFIRNKIQDQLPSLLHSPLSQYVPEETNFRSPILNRHLNLSCVFSEIGILLNSTVTEIEQSTVVEKIFNVSFALLHTFLTYLKQVEQTSRTEELIQRDVVYLNEKSLRVFDVSVFDGRSMCEGEIGIHARQSVALIAEVLPYSTYLRNCLKELVNVNIECSSLVSGKYLEILLECVTLVGKLRLSSMCIGFLCSVTRLITRMEQCSYERFGDFLDLLFKEVVLSRPEINALLKLSFFLRSISPNEAFVAKLCTMQVQNTLKFIAKEEYFIYNRNTCLFHVLCALYDSYLEFSESDLLVKMSKNFLCFIENASANHNTPWLYCKEQKTCKCLYMLIKLSIKFIVCCFNDFKKQVYIINDSLRLKYSQVFSLGIRLLHVIHFRMCIMEEYITMYAMFMDTVRKLYECRYEMQFEEETNKLIENLLSIDVEDSEVNVASDMFENMHFWKL